MKNNIVAVAFTSKGAELLAKISSLYYDDIQCFAPSRYASKNGLTPMESVMEWTALHFKNATEIIFVGAIGIAVRAIAPHIQSKGSDPAVVCIEDSGRYIIPILSGHIGGANDLAKNLANILNGTAIITTATDVNNCFSPDDWAAKNNYVIPKLEQIKTISAAILDSKEVGLKCDFSITGNLPAGISLDEDSDFGILISNTEQKTFKNTLWIAPKNLSIGVGCRKDVDSLDFENIVLNILKGNNLSIKSVVSIATITIKSEEKAILDFCKKYNLPLKIYTAQQLNEVKGSAASSEFVRSITGVDNVCERAALAENTNLIVEKTSGNGVTVAVATKEWGVSF